MFDTYTSIQNITKIFHKAINIRKYRKLSRNSLTLSPEIVKQCVRQAWLGMNRGLNQNSRGLVDLECLLNI